MKRAFTIKLGSRAREHIARHGLKPADIACVPAAAGGPKGLALLALDRWLFGHWLQNASDLTLIGASIGAWRMAAAAACDPLAALASLERSYIEDQNYGVKPASREVSARMRANLQTTFTDWRPRDNLTLRVVTSRGAGVLDGKHSRAAFGRAALANARGRRHLARHLRRVVFSCGPQAASDLLFRADAFGLQHVDLCAANACEALLASGSIPIACDPVEDIAGAPPGRYWDGGLIDYHLFYPYQRLDRLTLYPHFTSSVTPGWLDKFLPWRRQGISGRGAASLSSMILVAPAAQFVAGLPNARLPDRKDFYHYGSDHAARIAAWKRAVAECARFADEVAGWLEKPDLSIAQTL